MHKRGMWAAGLACVMIVEVGAARAAEDLLVVVEAPPQLNIDAGDVRRRIAIELGQPVISPDDPAAPRTSQVMIVALDRHDIRLTMRNGASSQVSRTIPDLLEHAARLRAVAWLAGNMVRDQVGPLLPRLALADPARVATTPTEALAPTPAAPAATTEPPPLPAPASPPAATVQRSDSERAEEPSSFDPRWVITASGGATFTDNCSLIGSTATRACAGGGGGILSFSYGSTYQLEVLHDARNGGPMIGAALETGPGSHLVGLAGLIGKRRPWGRWYLEATLGAGIEAERALVETSSVVNSSTMGVNSEITLSTQVEPALYVRAEGSIGIPINRTFDFLARISVHVSSSGLGADFIGATAGLRLKLL